MRTLLSLITLLLCPSQLWADKLPTAYPEQVGMSSERLQYADYAIQKAIDEGQMPGAVLAVVRKGRLVYLKAYGNRQVLPSKEPMTTQTVFDLASCTKPVATATAMMMLIEKGRVRTADPVSLYIPNFESWRGEGRDSVTIRISDLLTHTSGLPAYAPVASLKEANGMPNPKKLMDYIARCKREYKPRTKMQYSCLNYITLQHIIEKISQQSLRDFCANHIFIPLGMEHTDFIPCTPDKNGHWKQASPPRWLENGHETDFHPIAPTEKQADGSILLGQVHDPLARVMNGGVSGNAGLFSTAEDLALYCAMLQQQGQWNGRRILSPTTVKKMRTVPTAVADFGRAWGWDVSSPYISNQGDLLSEEAYGHTGYTGTSIVIDPVNDLSIILLANNVHPVDKNNIIRTRALVANAVAASITNEPAPFPDYYYKRMRVFDEEPTIKSTDFVMLGNSITEGGGNWNEKLKRKNVVNRGISSDVAMGVYNRLDKILPYHPAKIFLKIGINDVSHHLPTDTIVNRIVLVLDRIQKESPKTKLYLQSLLPIRETERWKNLMGKSGQIIEINERLKGIAKQKKITFINLYPLFVEKGTSVLRQELTYDGLHLSQEGYDVWVKELKKKM